MPQVRSPDASMVEEASQVSADRSQVPLSVISVQASEGPSVAFPFSLRLLEELSGDRGDGQPWRLSRLRWLDSQVAMDDGIVPPYVPVTVEGSILRGQAGCVFLVALDRAP